MRLLAPAFLRSPSPPLSLTLSSCLPSHHIQPPPMGTPSPRVHNLTARLRVLLCRSGRLRRTAGTSSGMGPPDCGQTAAGRKRRLVAHVQAEGSPRRADFPVLRRPGFAAHPDCLSHPVVSRAACRRSSAVFGASPSARPSTAGDATMMLATYRAYQSSQPCLLPCLGARDRGLAFGHGRVCLCTCRRQFLGGRLVCFGCVAVWDALKTAATAIFALKLLWCLIL